MEVGITRNDAQQIFEFQAVYNEFPGRDAKGGHLKPTQEQMSHHWITFLQDRVAIYNRIWILGKIASDFIYDRMSENRSIYYGKHFLRTIHPSRMNFALYQKKKKEIINSIETFLK